MIDNTTNHEFNNRLLSRLFTSNTCLLRFFSAVSISCLKSTSNVPCASSLSRKLFSRCGLGIYTVQLVYLFLELTVFSNFKTNVAYFFLIFIVMILLNLSFEEILIIPPQEMPLGFESKHWLKSLNTFEFVFSTFLR